MTPARVSPVESEIRCTLQYVARRGRIPFSERPSLGLAVDKLLETWERRLVRRKEYPVSVHPTSRFERSPQRFSTNVHAVNSGIAPCPQPRRSASFASTCRRYIGTNKSGDKL